MTASQQPTGHDKAVEWLALHLKRTRQDDDSGQPSMDDTITAGAALAALRAALAAGDADVAAALGLREQVRGCDHGFVHPVAGTTFMWSSETPCPTADQRRFVTDWTEQP